MTVMDYTAIFDYVAQPLERVITCNLCDETSITSERWLDRYGFGTWRSTCDGCGLITINPRMTKEAYQAFYQGPYRALVSAFHGREINAETLRPEQLIYAGILAEHLAPFLDRFVANTLLDIGGSTGVVAATIGSRFKISGTVLDPSLDELKLAMKAGLSTIVGTAEDFDAQGHKWDLILLCQTVDHLLDISGTLKKVHECLSTCGLFYVDIVDYDITKEIKIDHPFNLTPKTMKAYLDKTGFAVLEEFRWPDGKHVGFICEAA